MGLLLAAALGACGSDSPLFAYDDRPLAERLGERTFDEAAFPDATAGDASGEEAGDAPDAIAFASTGAPSAGSPDLATIEAPTETVKLRTGPGPGYDALLDVAVGADVGLSGNVTGEWTHVRYGDFEGWVATRFLVGADNGAEGTAGAERRLGRPTTYVVAGADIGVNVRAEPDSESLLVAGAPVGSIVEGTGLTEGDWVQVTYDGVTGWAFGGYLEPE